MKKNFIPLFGNPLYIKQTESKKSDFLKKNLDIKTYLKVKNFKQIEITEITLKGLNILKNIINNYALNNDYKNLVLSIKKSHLDFFIKNKLYIFNSEYLNFFNIITLDSQNNNYIYSYSTNETIKEGQDKNSIINIRQLFYNVKFKGEIVELEIENILIQKKIDILNLKLKNLELINLAQDRKNKFIYFTAKNLNNKIIKTKNNLIKIEQTIKDLVNSNYNFNIKKDTHPVNSLPNSSEALTTSRVSINEYIKSLTLFNTKRRGVLMVFSQTVAYNFITERRNIFKSIYKFLAASFMSLNCLISKPVFVITNDKIKIQLFYYLFKPRYIKKFWKLLLRRARRKRNLINSSINAKETNLVSENFVNKYKNIRLSKSSLNLFKSPNRTLIHQKAAKEKNTLYDFIKLNYKLLKFKNNKIRILRRNFLIQNRLKFKQICEILSRFFNKNVELNLIRLHYPYNDGNILVNFLALNIRTMKIRFFLSKLFKRAVFKKPINYKASLVDSRKNKTFFIPAFLSGMKIRIAGRLMTQSVIPRKTVKTTFRGASSTGKINYSQVSRFTSKNKRGAFSITISSGQNFY